MSGRLDAALIFEDVRLRGEGTNVRFALLLKEPPQRKVVVEGDAADAADEAVAGVHRLIAAHVDAFNSIELNIRFIIRLEVVRLRLVVVHRHHHL